MIRNPIIGLRVAANGDFIFEFFGEDGTRAEVVMTTVEQIEMAEAGFNWSAMVKRDFDMYGWDEVRRMHPELEIDPTNDYHPRMPDPDAWHDDPDNRE